MIVLSNLPAKLITTALQSLQSSPPGAEDDVTPSAIWRALSGSGHLKFRSVLLATMLDFATIRLTLLILSVLPLIILSKKPFPTIPYKDCDGSYSGPDAVANAINNNQDGFVIFSNGVKFTTAGPLRNGAPPTSWSQAQPGHPDLDWLYYNGTHLVSCQNERFASQQVDEKKWIVGKLISEELYFELANVITAYEDKLLIQTLNQQALVRGNHVELTAYMPNDPFSSSK
ncbi:hypothetical protein HDE_13108 [Halotydeus destructor]|nr:hypothetical protein HDE_13108 [Halotydeus destructor]